MLVLVMVASLVVLVPVMLVLVMVIPPPSPILVIFAPSSVPVMLVLMMLIMAPVMLVPPRWSRLPQDPPRAPDRPPGLGPQDGAPGPVVLQVVGNLRAPIVGDGAMD